MTTKTVPSSERKYLFNRAQSRSEKEMIDSLNLVQGYDVVGDEIKKLRDRWIKNSKGDSSEVVAVLRVIKKLEDANLKGVSEVFNVIDSANVAANKKRSDKKVSEAGMKKSMEAAEKQSNANREELLRTINSRGRK